MNTPFKLFTSLFRTALIGVFGLLTICTLSFLSGAHADSQSGVVAEAAFAQQQKLTAADGVANDLFGCAVAIDGNTAVVGANKDRGAKGLIRGAAYVFVRAGNAWVQQQELSAGADEDGDRFGASVAISGNTIVVGAPLDDIRGNVSQGSAYVFVRAGNVWSLQQKLGVRTGKAGDAFGTSVAIKGDTIAIGALRATVGANISQGAAYLFTRTGNAWTQQQTLTASDGANNDFFGIAVALDDNLLAVGAAAKNQSQGAAYVFTKSGTQWSETQKLIVGDGAAGDSFGRSLAVNGDTLVIGSPSNKSINPPTDGSAYVFKRAGNLWAPQQKLFGEDGGDIEGFGSSVSVIGDRVAVGAFFFQVGTASGQGAAFVFTQANGVWTRTQKLTADDGASGDNFGIAVALSSNAVIVGADFRVESGHTDQGAAYIFTDPSDDGLPKIQGVGILGKKLIVTGANFESPTEILVNGEQQKKTFNDDANPTATVIAKKGGRLIAPGQTVTVQVRNGNGDASNQFIFTRPLQ